MFHEVSNDLMVDIFEKLPLKSIIRFRSLSKYWHSRILSHEFIRSHSLRCSKNSKKIIIRHLTYCEESKFKNIYTLHAGDRLPLDPGFGYTDVPAIFEFPNPRRTDEVVGSCNGILCLRNTEIILCNFSVRRKLIVPCHPRLKFSFTTALGFGFDPIADDYKIVAMPYDKYGLGRSDTFIYSLKTDSWNTIPSPAIKFSNMKSSACFFNGILHWVVDGHLTDNPSQFILTFNVSTHVFGGILFRMHSNVRQLTTLNGCLAVVSFEGDDTWKIQVMNEYCKIESWSVVFELKAKEYEVIRVFQAVTNGDILVYEGSEVYNYQSSREHSNIGPKLVKLEMETYAESLELLDIERAQAYEETRFSGTKKAIKSQKNSIIARIKRKIKYRLQL